MHRHLLAVQRDDRLSVLYSNKDYSSECGTTIRRTSACRVDNTSSQNVEMSSHAEPVRPQPRAARAVALALLA